MTRAALYELVDMLEDRDVSLVFSFLSRIVGADIQHDSDSVVPLPDELEIIAYAKRAKAAGEELYTLDDCR